MWTAHRALFAAALVTGASALHAPLHAQDAAGGVAVGGVAPDFAVTAATRYGVLGEPIRLSDFRGKTVVLAFFPRARTQGCTIQMRAYRDQYAELFRDGQDVVLIAMSADPVEELHAWARDEQFQFVMASDADLTVATQYGAVGARGGMTNRNLYVIGPDGNVSFRATPFREIDPTAYAELDNAISAIERTAMME